MVHQAVHNLEKNISHDKRTLAAFIGMEVDFNKVTFRAVNVAFRNFGLHRTLIRWMAMLGNRLLTLNLLGILEEDYPLEYDS